ncbi:CHD3-type chromatin-remodeling factor PICKLE-like isoform X1 [Silene latifolia]|uniref:CHD3-type chromatin-remodeling factor PICKLE-like isoform X1 n=1 Tax=Silene latifolia TaxID=37657 RepID=UPI003D76ACBA
MSSLVERLRQRSDRRPSYNIDFSDDEADHKQGKSALSSEKFERFVREDAKDDACQSCGESGNYLLECKTCTYTFHPQCLVPSLKAPFPDGWKCPECVSPLNEIEKILDCEMRPIEADDGDASTPDVKQVSAKHYLVKWKGLSYLHCSWVPEKQFIKAFKTLPGLRTKVNNFHRQMSSMNNLDDDYVAIRPEWTTVDRILACRGDDEKEYLVKWKELPYDECYWEFEADISAFQPEIERFNWIQARHHRPSKLKKVPHDAMDSQKKHKDFQQFEHSPNFLSGGSLHPYQLEGLNFLRFSWSKQTHVILADEMGLGKTIQSIAFLASLFEEGVYPHLVVAPLSTLRNWEREFATWAPQLNVIMYVGSGQARAIIRQYEFYYPKKSISAKLKKKKSGQISGESKHDRIKFDVLLTSYEMINLDSASLKPIKWECMVVDEGHRLKNKDSKLFLMLKQFSSKHRVLLTGTPLQNNLDELFVLMHFLDAGKFGSLEEFQEEFQDINQEEQISRLHKMLAPHLLRRVKKDVMKELPPKKELILRVELSSKQKEYYKAILTRNYGLLTRKGGGQISLINVVMELRKLCCHPYMLEGVEPVIQDSNESFKQLLESSGKLQLLDKMMVKLKEQGHRVLIYSQFQNMLDILEDYMTYKKWVYERIDGKVSGAERQIRIDRYNAKSSSRFCFLLSTRAGGLGINLATADTVIIYDSDWNPHADLQAMARAHRLGQTNKVMIYRLVTRGSIEERMMQMTKKKMVLEHLVVGKLKTQNINQEELDDIIRYGSKELFTDETEEAKARQIHYDDTAIDRLLDRERVGDEENTLDEVDDNGFLKAFKVANFEYVDEVEAAAEEEAQKAAADAKNNTNTSERTTYWEDLLKDKYEVQIVEEFNSLGKGKRSRKQEASSSRSRPPAATEVIQQHVRGHHSAATNSSRGRCSATTNISQHQNQQQQQQRTQQHSFLRGWLETRLTIPSEAITLDDDPVLPLPATPLKQKRFTNLEKSEICQRMTMSFQSGKLKHGLINQLCTEYGVSRVTISKIWKKVLTQLKDGKVVSLQRKYKGSLSKTRVIDLEKMVSVEDDDLAGLEDVSSDGEDDNYEAELSDSETMSAGVSSGRRAYRKRARVDIDSLPLMEGEGKSFRVLGFNQSQRAAFVQVLMRFGAGDYDWVEFVPRLKQKTYEEIENYGQHFIAHLAEGINDSPTFSDGVPKEGLMVQDVLYRIGLLQLIREKVKFASDNREKPLFDDDIIFRYPTLKGGRMWNEDHDLILLRAVLKHGYGRWQAILDDKELKIEEVICKDLNLPMINLASLASNQPQVGSTIAKVEQSGDSQKGAVSQNGPAFDSAPGGTDTTLLFQFREMQRRQVEFIKKRVLLLEKGLAAEYQKEYYGDGKPNGLCAEGHENDNKGEGMASSTGVADIVTGLVDKLPRIEVLTAKEVYPTISEIDPRRQEVAQYYNELCKLFAETEKESVKAILATNPDQYLGKKLDQLEAIRGKIRQLFNPTQHESNLT